MEQPGASQGWQAPQTDQDIQRWFFSKHGDDSYTRASDRKWATLGRLIASGARIRDGRLG